ncbi:exopolysaccharide production protein ExoZ [Caulobacter ginsengisoli]|uniref:Exopolysaccharide production protein ExoZ n=1 Tax=Caulobacter ginsengisoli TaxID=400775 RepID=A0ABU0IKZ0_9CAUL|nr:acyltransferase [Caulobacter ginsengisoli]MDQ0462683.1 exopolysaccharide production protein ExoZ [Caulobacter ginsengisoli]
MQAAENLRSIQYLRALAALSVVFYHATQWASVPVDIGSAGVDVFFVISGFIMWRTTSDGATGPGRFLAKRAIRIVPLYWLITLGLTIAAVLAPTRFTDQDPQPVHVILSLAFIQHLNPRGEPFPLLGLGWTLNYEAFFYVLFAIALALPRTTRLLFLGFVLVTGAIAGLMCPPAYVLLLNPMLLEFLSGVLLAAGLGKGPGPGRSIGWLMFGVGVAAFGALALGHSAWDAWRPFLWGPPALLLVAGLACVEADGGMRRMPPLGLMGDASYSTYLTHPLTLGAFAMTFGVRPLWLWLPLALIVSQAAGIACWFLIERPMTRMLKRRLLDAGKPSHTSP